MRNNNKSNNQYKENQISNQDNQDNQDIIKIIINFFLIGIHSMQGCTAITWHGVTKKKKHRKIKAYRKSVQKETTVKRCLLILDLKPLRT